LLSQKSVLCNSKNLPVENICNMISFFLHGLLERNMVNCSTFSVFLDNATSHAKGWNFPLSYFRKLPTIYAQLMPYTFLKTENLRTVRRAMDEYRMFSFRFGKITELIFDFHMMITWWGRSMLLVKLLCKSVTKVN